jgi:hypothetical protein
MNISLDVALRAFSIAALLGLAASASAADPAPIDSSVEELAISLAQTPAQHETVAAFYDSKAAEARAAAKRHTAMARTHTGKGEPMAGHCRNLAKTYGSLAKEYDALAREHRNIAAGRPAGS